MSRHNIQFHVIIEKVLKYLFSGAFERIPLGLKNEFEAAKNIRAIVVRAIDIRLNWTYRSAKTNFENTPNQIYRKFHHQKKFQNKKKKKKKNSDIFHISVQNIHCGTR